MTSSAAGRAVPDALAAAAAYGLSALWLLSISAPGFPLQLAGMFAGALVTGGAAASVLRRVPRFSTPADRVTLLRAVLAALCAALAVPQLFTGPRADLLIPVLGGLAFLLDGLDGAVARRTGTSSTAGARFDAATDAGLVLALSVAAAARVGPWVLAVGGMYYVFVAAGRFRPQLRAVLPPSPSRKAIGAFQPFALLISLIPGIPAPAAVSVQALALAVLAFSFTRDVVQLETGHRAVLLESDAAKVGTGPITP
ncbi:CDP-alcohol phosphatidyltransferase family protein [Arthrobacter sp. SLBN-112]|uniref:CDP-alcohol phosphatidyltransferase family protein n=1 Tax=Arthrobacter sp. SLBN-112 TaxID=2768452 RepID=UPI0027B582E7|nr:CDP-alcohol phosphatidyltransferase family protein [Arthrobacter sp. SLBN-112]MDQ0800007.1 phosphatidylglycerophosphate synthase [Arthrobacter sp. SLBN-112]